MKLYASIFVKTFEALAAAALIGAAGYSWATDQAVSSATLLGWSLVGAAIGAVIAVLYAVATQPATTRLGRSLRSGVQALLGTPLAALVVDGVDSQADVTAAVPLVVPAVVMFVLAFGATWLLNGSQLPTTDNKPVGGDFLGTSE